MIRNCDNFVLVFLQFPNRPTTASRILTDLGSWRRIWRRNSIAPSSLWSLGNGAYQKSSNRSMRYQFDSTLWSNGDDIFLNASSSNDLKKRIISFQAQQLSIESRNEAIFVSPRTGMWLRKLRCTGDGNVTVFTGPTTLPKYLLRTWP